MTSLRQTLMTISTGLLLGFATLPASAATIVKVDLTDQGAGMQMPTGVLYAAPDLDKSKATMAITATPPTARAGIISFEVKNSSKDTIHEMIVMYLADPSQQLPYLTAENRVDEDKAGDKGEVSELDPGHTGVLTVALKPGKYLLICNVPGHFTAGMWTEFEVTK